MYDSNSDSYTLSATRIIAGFANPVDETIDSNKIYVLENGYAGTAGLYEVTMPSFIAGVQEQKEFYFFDVSPNPSAGIFSVNFNKKNTNAKICVYDVLGNCLLNKDCGKNTSPKIDGSTSLNINLSSQPKGIYFVKMISENETQTRKIIVE